MLKKYIEENKVVIEKTLENLLQPSQKEYKSLYEAMQYSLLLGGKRIRPLLTKMVVESLGKKADDFLEIICAIELIHTYSLIHDDLPAMDDDDYRRGKLTNHKVFGEGIAILAGDGLLTFAFQLIADSSTITDRQKVEIIRILSKSSGPSGMVGGQAFDLLSEGKKLSLEELQIMHNGKTGALFQGAVEIGLVLGEANETTTAAFLDYAQNLGLLFQITDDILDVVGTMEELGKTPGSDVRDDKATYVSLLTLPVAQNLAKETATSAKLALSQENGKTDLLLELVEYLLCRTN